MAVILKIRIAEKTGELIKVISQFRAQGHLPTMYGKETDENPAYQIVALKMQGDAKTARSVAAELGHPVVDIAETAGEVRNTAASEPVALDIDDLRARYISVLGPIGGALFDETIEALGDELGTAEGNRTFVERLAEQIDEENEAIRFRHYAGIRV